MILRRSFCGLFLGVVACAQSSLPPPQMQSVGVRGAIDDAGYSAPAAAEAKSNITRLLLNLQFKALQQTMANSNCSGCSAHERQGFEAELHQQFEVAAEHFHASLTCSPPVENRFAYGSLYSSPINQTPAAALSLRRQIQAPDWAAPDWRLCCISRVIQKQR